MVVADGSGVKPEVALILAAGLGSRLSPKFEVPKPLIKVLGLTLAERVVRTLRMGANIRRFVVSIGHETHAVRAGDRRTGEVTTFAGQPGQSGSEDGVGGAARFSVPRGLALDGDTLCGIPCQKGEPL